ncbi:hypothetical protein AB9K29_16805 [Phaeobacter italicus]|uniref:hypothetical protein n=1 Tax=Phaeobacter italicus TaxID=481446 RepID=UPI003516C1D4
MFRKFAAATAISFTIALPVQAEQFAVQLDASYGGASANLMEALKVSEIEAFSEDNAHYVVLDAPNEAYVEAFILAIGREAVGLNALEANWSNPSMQHLSIAQRLGFFRAIACEFCSS